MILDPNPPDFSPHDAAWKHHAPSGPDREKIISTIVISVLIITGLSLLLWGGAEWMGA